MTWTDQSGATAMSALAAFVHSPGVITPSIVTA
jgi:hypothetical protein